MKITFLRVTLLLFINLLAGTMLLMGQDEPVRPGTVPITSADVLNTRVQVGDAVMLEGTLTAITARSHTSGAHGDRIVTLYAPQGEVIAHITNLSEDSFSLDPQVVRLTGQLLALATQESPAQVDYRALEVVNTVTPSALTGIMTFMNLMCRFPDVADEPWQSTPEQIQAMFGNTSPNLGHYWDSMSYGEISILPFTTEWFTLPQPRAAYFTGNTPNIPKITQDCIDLADPTYGIGTWGIHFMMNADLGDSYFIGNIQVRAEGNFQVIRAVWAPPWAQRYEVFSQSMGWMMGLSYSTGPASLPPANLLFNSAWDVMSDSGGVGYWDGYCPSFHPRYGCYPQGITAAQLTYPGWLPASSDVVLNNASSFLIRPLRGGSVAGQVNAVIANVWNDSSRFYTVEVRDNTGYDQWNMPIVPTGGAVIIHLVDKTRSKIRGQPLVVTAGGSQDLNGPPGQWLPGESYVDSARQIVINVISRENGAIRVNVGSNQTYPTYDAVTAARPIVLQNGYYTNIATDILATQSPSDAPICNGRTGYYTLWYRYTAPLNMPLRLAFGDSSRDGMIGVYQGTPSNLTPVACIDSSAQDGFEVSLTRNTTYYIVTASKSPANYGQFQFSAWDYLNPGPTTLIAPVDGGTIDDSTPTFTWSAVPNAVNYDILYRRLPGTSWSYVLDLTGTSYTMPSALPIGTYEWFVVTQRYTMGSDSAQSTFELVSSPSDAPIRNRFTTRQPTLTWASVNQVSSTGFPVSYRVQVSRQSNFGTSTLDTILNATTMTFTFPLADGVYYWRVQAVDGNGPVSPWSATEAFIIEASS